MSTGGSRLAEMQARFQQRQLIEKEQKLLKIYEQNQAKVLGRLGAQTPAAPAGKVRQMFEERRTKAGIDKSYPLQPLAGARAPPRTNGNLNHNVTLEIKQTSTMNGDVLKSHRIETRIIRDSNLNESVDEVDSLDYEQTLEPVMNKLPNVGRSLRKTEPNNNARNQTTNRSPATLVNGKASPKERKPLKPSPAPAAAPPRANPPRPAPKTPVSTPKPRSLVSSPQISNAQTPVKNGISAEKIKSPPKPAQSPVAPQPRTFTPSNNTDGEPCKICQRRFAADRIQKHEEICAKTAAKKRKQYDATKHRVAGTEAESYVVRSAKKTTKVQPVRNAPAAKPSNWRKKHEEFIQAIRAAKQVKLHLSKGGKLSDLPPPPPSDTSDYVSCPHCNRRFNESAAQRHIPKCANYQFNKPKPVAKKR